MALVDASQESDGSGGGIYIYLEVTEGNIRGKWKLEEPMNFWRFRGKLANGMLKYKTSARNYPGGENMRP